MSLFTPHSPTGLNHVVGWPEIPQSDLPISLPRQTTIQFEGSGIGAVSIPEDQLEFLRLTNRDGIINVDAYEHRKPQARAIMRFDETDKNFILAAPTGEGKTFWVLGALARCLKESDKPVLILTRQVKLVNQFLGDATKALDVEANEIATLTGELSGGQREQLYRDESIRLFIATPQTEVNDAGVDRKSNLEKTLQKLDLSRFSAIVFDECHHLRKNDAYARIVRFILGKSSGGPRLIGLSATPAETDEELDRIIDLFGGNSNVDCVRIDASAKPKRYLPKILSLPPVIIETGRPLEEAIRDVHGDLVSLLQEIAKASAAKRGHGSCNMQEIVKTAQSLVEDVSGIARVKGENVCSQFAKELRAELNADSSTRRMVGDRISLLGALGRYHRYLVDNGRALFLDRLGRDLASYRLGGYIPEEESVDGVASLISGEERDWLFRMLNNNYALSGYRVCFEESFRRAAVGTLYEAVLTSRDFYSFASIVAGWDPNKTDSFRSQNVAFNELFTLLRKDLSGKRYWYDHPITEQAIRIAKKHIEDGKPGRILVRAKVFERASYLAEVLSTRLKEYEQSASSVAGRKYMPHNLASERIQSFGEGDVIALVGTSFLAEGHHIPDADTLILTDPIVTGIEGIQFAGRVGRLGFGFVHALLTPGTLRAYFSGLARQRRSVKLVHRRFRV